MPATIADLATEFGVTERSVRMFVDQLALVDGYDATYTDEEATTLTDDAAKGVREAFTAHDYRADELMHDVTWLAKQYREATVEADAARGRRDAAIRSAVAHGLNRTMIAHAAYIRRERLYQILDEAKAQ